MNVCTINSTSLSFTSYFVLKKTFFYGSVLAAKRFFGFQTECTYGVSIQTHYNVVIFYHEIIGARVYLFFFTCFRFFDSSDNHFEYLPT